MHLIDSCAHCNRWRTRSPGEKLLLAGGMLLLSISLPPFPSAGVIAVVMACITLLGARIPWRIYVHAMAAPVGFLLTAALAMMVSVHGGIRAGWHVEISGVAVASAATVTMRAIASLFCLLFLALTTPIVDLLPLLRRVRVPAAAVGLMLLIYRLLFVLDRTASSARAAQASRLGYRNRQCSFRSMSLLAAALFGSVLDRAGRLEMGLASRGYQDDLRVLAVERPVSRGALAATVMLLGAVTTVGLLAGGR